jgi:hypothetical protein
MKFLILLLFFSCAQGPILHQTSTSVLQLGVTENSTEFNILANKNETLEAFVLTEEGENLAPTAHEIATQVDSDWAIHQFHFSVSKPTEKNFRLLIKKNNKVVDERLFKLFSNQGESLKFIVGSCADHRMHEHQRQMWQTVAAQKPEWLFLIGDNLYSVFKDSEVKDERMLWERYVESRRTLELYQLKELIPMHATWDDNDYGQKDGGQSYQLKEASQKIFKTFFAPRFTADNLIAGPGIATRLNLRGMHFTFLDNRSFRDNESLDGEHFGVEQEAWLFKDLQTAQLPTWIISGDQFFGGYQKFESFEGRHPRAFESFLNRLKDVSTPFVFVSGDRHMTEIMQFPKALFGQLSFEFTASPFHSKIYPGSGVATSNPWRVVARDDQLNFMLIQTKLEETSWNIDVQSLNFEGKELFRRDLSLTTEALKDFTIEKRQKRRRYRRARWRRR